MIARCRARQVQRAPWLRAKDYDRDLPCSRIVAECWMLTLGTEGPDDVYPIMSLKEEMT